MYRAHVKQHRLHKLSQYHVPVAARQQYPRQRGTPTSSQAPRCTKGPCWKATPVLSSMLQLEARFDARGSMAQHHHRHMQFQFLIQCIPRGPATALAAACNLPPAACSTAACTASHWLHSTAQYGTTSHSSLHISLHSTQLARQYVIVPSLAVHATRHLSHPSIALQLILHH